MPPITFNIIGAGRLGKVLVSALLELKDLSLTGVCNAHFETALNIVNTFQQGQAVAALSELPQADITFITTQDNVISKIVTELSKNPAIAESIVVHCSGALASNILSPLKARHCHLVSIHPLKAFHQKSISKNPFHACLATIEGEPHAVKIIKTLFNRLGAEVIPMPTSNKTSYHAGAVMASNYLITLAQSAYTLLKNAELAQAPAKRIVEQLMRNSLDNLESNTEVSEALTGPLMRGDIETIRGHLEVIPDLTTKNFYCAAALATLPLTALDAESKALLKTLLTIGLD